MSPQVSHSALLGACFLVSQGAFETNVTGLQTFSLTSECQLPRPYFYYLHLEYLMSSSLADGLESTWSHRYVPLPEHRANVYWMPVASLSLTVKSMNRMGGQFGGFFL